MKAIKILKSIQDDTRDKFYIEVEEAIKELETLQDKLKKAQIYILDLENQLKNKSNGLMNK